MCYFMTTLFLGVSKISTPHFSPIHGEKKLTTVITLLEVKVLLKLLVNITTSKTIDTTTINWTEP